MVSQDFGVAAAWLDRIDLPSPRLAHKFQVGGRVQAGNGADTEQGGRFRISRPVHPRNAGMPDLHMGTNAGKSLVVGGESCLVALDCWGMILMSMVIEPREAMFTLSIRDRGGAGS